MAGAYQHGEAFCRMRYEADDRSESEIIWNSRDGVTPFVITLRSGKTARHVAWQDDQRMPEDYQPPAGSRMFVDMTRERARELGRANAERFWDHPEFPARAHYQSIEELAELLAAEYLKPGSPDLVEVPQ